MHFKKVRIEMNFGRIEMNFGAYFFGETTKFSPKRLKKQKKYVTIKRKANLNVD